MRPEQAGQGPASVPRWLLIPRSRRRKDRAGECPEVGLVSKPRLVPYTQRLQPAAPSPVGQSGRVSLGWLCRVSLGVALWGGSVGCLQAAGSAVHGRGPSPGSALARRPASVRGRPADAGETGSGRLGAQGLWKAGLRPQPPGPSVWAPVPGWVGEGAASLWGVGGSVWQGVDSCRWGPLASACVGAHPCPKGAEAAVEQRAVPRVTLWPGG